MGGVPRNDIRKARLLVLSVHKSNIVIFMLEVLKIKLLYPRCVTYPIEHICLNFINYRNIVDVWLLHTSGL